jgi:hypothetical protein
MWFVEKLGPLPGSPQAKSAANGAAKPAPKSAAAPSRPAQQPGPAAQPEPPKKKKGWF